MSGAAALLCCCGGCDTVTCADCDGTPATDSFTVTFDGVTLSDCCYTNPDNSFKIKINPAFVLDGTYCLNATGTTPGVSCCWVSAPLGSVAAYAEGDCADIGTSPGDFTRQAFIWIARFGGKFHLWVGATDGGDSIIAILFHAEIAQPCDFPTATVSNDAAVLCDEYTGPIDDAFCQGFFYFPGVFSDTGTATITPCC